MFWPIHKSVFGVYNALNQAKIWNLSYRNALDLRKMDSKFLDPLEVKIASVVNLMHSTENLPSFRMLAG